MRKWRTISVPQKAHPFVRRLFERMIEERIGVLDLAERAGVSKNTLGNWRVNDEPSLSNLQACLQVVGLELQIVPIAQGEPEPEEEARPFDYPADWKLPRQQRLALDCLLSRPSVREMQLRIAIVPAQEEPSTYNHMKTVVSQLRRSLRGSGIEIVPQGEGRYGVVDQAAWAARLRRHPKGRAA